MPVTTHPPLQRLPEDQQRQAEARFFDKVTEEGATEYAGLPCWLWTGGLVPDGYGQFWLNGRPQRTHRVCYEWLVAPIPEGLVLDHLCRVPHCVNPYHLDPVPQRVNMLRGERWASRRVA